MQTMVYAWLGQWMDKMPHEAVSDLQDLLGPLNSKATADAPEGPWEVESAGKVFVVSRGDGRTGFGGPYTQVEAIAVRDALNRVEQKEKP